MELFDWYWHKELDEAEDSRDCARAFQGKPFARVLTRPSRYPTGLWRISQSGVFGWPWEAGTTAAVVGALQNANLSVGCGWSGSPANAEEYHVQARFLDGGMWGFTGNYLGLPRGSYIQGSEACLFVALALGLTVSNSCRSRHGLPALTLPTLREKLGDG